MRSSHSLGSAPSAIPAPRSRDNAAIRAAVERSRRINDTSVAVVRLGLLVLSRLGHLGGFGSHDSEQRQAARERTGNLAVGDDVIRETRRRSNTGLGARGRRAVTL